MGADTNKTKIWEQIASSTNPIFKEQTTSELVSNFNLFKEENKETLKHQFGDQIYARFFAEPVEIPQHEDPSFRAQLEEQFLELMQSGMSLGGKSY